MKKNYKNYQFGGYLGSKAKKPTPIAEISEIIDLPNSTQNSEAQITTYDNNLFDAVVQINADISFYEKELQEDKSKMQQLKREGYSLTATISKELYAEIVALADEIQDLRQKRNTMIDKMIRFSTFSDQELLWILEQFGENYKLEDLKNRRRLLPDVPITTYDNNLFDAVVQINADISFYEKELQEEKNKMQQLKGEGYSLAVNIPKGLYIRIVNLTNEIQDLKRRRKAMIDKIIRFSTFSVQELLWILEQFGEYYKLEHFNNRSFLMPLDFNIVNQGPKKYISEEELQHIKMECSTNTIGENSYYHNTTALYKTIDERVTLTNGIDFVTVRIARDPITHKIKYGISINEAQMLNKAGMALAFNYLEDTPARVEFNEDMKCVAPIIEVNPTAGVAFYRHDGDEAVLNTEATNVIPKTEIMSFIEYYIEAKFDDETCTLYNVFTEWNNRYSRVRK